MYFGGMLRHRQVDVIRHRMPLNDLTPLLLTQISEDPADLFSHIPVKRTPTILRDKHNVVHNLQYHCTWDWLCQSRMMTSFRFG